ncbi:class 1b ribonucleoside-diphosphate reductase subunit alpha [Leuconostoc gelidum subsp. gasicomitatum]|uniref:class 1b ribonucleoside-diphosphate reductase subunit alpha n=1 Tax=Leuconostoc gasicomitatum TaxID=115778 RepID=UPI0007DE70F6|nr:class 1b ribonucleoside-diphosphate reductase subunit alpha [Leuconostoc gasicomitatum]MBZ5947357.1 class 1b ribonucleoside-diphosphate reductase subunit alpha [Leuconostoc gasicomitatum]CUW17381.1 Ribonucleotide reductase of class Ib (aerobic), alpha subunit [Leuconostoc gasicomitatum]
MPLKELNLDQVTYFDLNNQVNIPKNNQIQLEKDQEALDAFLKENVWPNVIQFDSLADRFEWLFENNFLERVFIEKYRLAFIEKLYTYLESQHFNFKSFMAAFKFYNQYALKTNDGQQYVETYVDRVAMNALYYADGREELALRLADEMIHQRYQPATPSFLNAGRARRGELVSCFIIQTSDDMNSIGRTVNSALQLSKMGGGVGINVSNVREAGAPVMGISNSAGGIVPIMKLLEDSFTFSSQVGARQGAGVVYLSVFHPDIMAFLSTKKENADEKIRVKTLSLGLTIPDKFYDLVRKNDVMYLFSPVDVEKVYGKPFNYIDITSEYDNMVNNDKITKYHVDARFLEEEISKLQQESGYPYVINIDVANRANPIAGKIISSNLCSEILQVQTPSELDNGQQYTRLGSDVSCNLGSINIVNMMATNNFGESVDTMVRALTYVSDTSNLDVVPSIAKGNTEKHAIGLGAMGLAAYFAQNKMYYGDEESLDFTTTFFMTLNYYSIKASMAIAKERNDTFFEFEKSTYADGSYFDKYLEEDWAPRTQKVAASFAQHNVPTKHDWAELKADVAKYGMYNAYRHAIAPTGSISYVNDTTATLLPIVNKIEERQEGMIGKVYYPAPGLNNETMPYYVSAYDIDMRKVIDIYAAAQEHIDQGMALTLFMRSTLSSDLYEWKKGRTDKMTTRDLTILRHYAFNKGIKSLYYVRTFTDDNQESGVNECESCSI